MDFLTSAILSGILYDLIKKGVELNYKNVFMNSNSNSLDYLICKEFLTEINTIKDQNEKLLLTNKLLSEENKYTTMFEQNMYTTNFAKRLDYILILMQDSGYYGHKINLEKAGEFLGFKSVNDLKKYYLSQEEPEYDFIEFIAEKFGINAEWLKFGFGAPFKTSYPGLYRATEILWEENCPKEIKEIFFAVEDEIYRRHFGVIFKLSDYRYDYCPHPFIFHADVGGSGASELFSVYSFLKELRNRNMLPYKVYKVPTDYFQAIFRGESYAGSVVKYKTDTYLIEDFLDLYKSQEKKMQYIKLHGKVLVDCQDIIKNFLT